MPPQAADQGGGVGGGTSGGGGGTSSPTGTGGRGGIGPGGRGGRPGKNKTIQTNRGGGQPRPDYRPGNDVTKTQIDAAKQYRTGVRAFSVAGFGMFHGDIKGFARTYGKFQTSLIQVGIKSGRIQRVPGFSLPPNIEFALKEQEKLLG